MPTTTPTAAVATRPPGRAALYAGPITTVLRTMDLTADPRHVEAYMRCEFSTLDHLSPRDFACEVLVAVDCITAGGDDAAESLARSFGL